MLLQASPFPQTSSTACTFALVLVARSDSLLSGAGYATSVAQNCRGESPEMRVQAELRIAKGFDDLMNFRVALQDIDDLMTSTSHPPIDVMAADAQRSVEVVHTLDCASTRDGRILPSCVYHSVLFVLKNWFAPLWSVLRSSRGSVHFPTARTFPSVPAGHR